MENELPKSGDIISERSEEKISYDPNAVFKNKNVSLFGVKDNVKIQYKEFTTASGKRKWINSLIVVVVFLLMEALIIANYPPARKFVCDFFAIGK